jgi:hypothetical protein
MRSVAFGLSKQKSTLFNPVQPYSTLFKPQKNPETEHKAIIVYLRPPEKHVGHIDLPNISLLKRAGLFYFFLMKSPGINLALVLSSGFSSTLQTVS